MGTYLTAGHTYSDTSPNNVVNGANLNEHVNNAVFETTSISSQTLKDPAALSDEILINDGGSFKKITIQQIYAALIQPGTVVQTAYSEYTANTNLTTVLPVDDTVPQNTEGTEILSATITPRFATSTILVRFEGQGSSSSIVTLCAALFRDSIVNALASRMETEDTANFARAMSIVYMDSPATASAVTYKIRVGAGSAATIRMNGSTASRFFGGTSRSTLVVQEIKV
jgi:hypothetical protein